MVSQFVKIYNYNPCWPECYERSVKKIKKFLPAHIKTYFMHVGSTSIPGSLTSGNLDIALGIRNVLDLITIRDIMVAHGYKFDVKNSKMHHYVVTRGINGTLTVKVHIIVVNSEPWRRMALFKDYLIHNNQARDAYSNLRYSLYKNETITYTEYSYQKRLFQDEILARIK